MNSTDDYISGFPPHIQTILQNIRTVIREAAPGATESIAYGMPAWKTGGKPLVYFAAFKHHIGFYALPSGHTQFDKELSDYRRGKGSVQFLTDQPIPYDLIRRIVEFRVLENSNGVHPDKKIKTRNEIVP